MANIQERRDKAGKLISYSIQVHRDRRPDWKQFKPWTTTFEVSPTRTEKSAQKKAEAFAATLEKDCREGTTTDSRQKFGPYCEYVIRLKEQLGSAKHSTFSSYRDLAAQLKTRKITRVSIARSSDLSECIISSPEKEENVSAEAMDSVSISKRLGHSRVSTTADIYSHVIAAAGQKSADILADLFLKKA